MVLKNICCIVTNDFTSFCWNLKTSVLCKVTHKPGKNDRRVGIKFGKRHIIYIYIRGICQLSLASVMCIVQVYNKYIQIILPADKRFPLGPAHVAI